VASPADMKNLVKKGQALPAPGQDRGGRFPIRNGAELQKAIKAVGRVKPDTDAARATVRRYIIGRARALNLASAIPDTWDSSGNLKPGASS